MSIKLNVALDLGGDSLKVSFAYKTSSGKIECGKFSSASSSTSTALPAIAFFDDKSEKWMYGETVDKYNGDSFVKVVKIKSLLSFLLNSNTEKHYFENSFPKFAFPKVNEDFKNFPKAIEEGKTFTNDNTLKEVSL